MSLLNKASLIQIPSGYKDGTLYSAKPTNGDGDFTFSRGSNLAATRVNSEGLIEKGRENLLLQSNTFDTTWGNNNSTETGGQTGYDGSSNAWLLANTASAGSIGQSVSNSGVQTFSVYAKAGSLNWMAFTISGISPSQAYFDLQNGALGSIGTEVISTKIDSIGSDWYRCSIIVNGAATGVNIYPANANNSVSVLGNIYIQDAQLEVGLVATDYIPTTTTTEQAGILEDMPRLDYSGGATCPSLLLEPQRSNLVDQSENATAWSKSNLNATTNYGTSPEGVSNSVLIESTSTSGGHYFGAGNMSITNGTTYVGSIFVKQGTARYFQLLFGGSAFGSESYANFDLQEGSVTKEGTNIDAQIESYGNNWYRVSIVGPATATAIESIYSCVITSPTAARVQLHTSVLNNEVYGAMVEEGSYPTSYIPTYGSSVTRNNEQCVNTSALDVIGQTEGTMYVETTLQNIVDNKTLLRMGQSASFSNSHILQVINQKVYAESYVGGTNQAEIFTTAFSDGDKVKIGYAYKANDYVLYVNGSQIGTDTSASVPSSVDTLYVGNIASTEQHPVDQTLLFKTRLTNDELAELTTI